MSGYNPNNFQQQQQGQGQPQQGQYGNVNMRPISQGSNQPFQPNPNPTQGNMGFNSNHLQQLNDFHSRQPVPFVGQQQQQGQFGQDLGGNYQQQQFGNALLPIQPQASQSAVSFQQQQQQQAAYARLQRQQQQYLQAAQQVRAQAQATQGQGVPRRQDPSPRTNAMPLPGALQAASAQHAQQQRPATHGNGITPSHLSIPALNPIPPPPIPMPMQRTFSNQSNGSASGPGGSQSQSQMPSRPQMPISGYQPHLSMNTSSAGLGNVRPGSSGGPNDRVPNSSTNSDALPLPFPLPLTQINDPARTPTSTTNSPTPAPDSGSKPSTPAPRTGTEPAKKKRKKDDGAARPAGKKEEKPLPVAYFTGAEKVKEDVAPAGGRGVNAERAREVQQGGPGAISTARAGGQATGVAPPRRKVGTTESMRGSMRDEIVALMYAAGDVERPRIDAVNYVEDLVVEFMADLCRPAPPIRSFPGAPYTAPPLTASMIRYRLSTSSHPSMKKYAARFDYMIGMDEEIERQKAGAGGSHEDIVNIIPTGYLGIGDGEGGENGEKKKGDKAGQGGKRGRPKRVEGGVTGERRKPGPKKGWKDKQGTPGDSGRKRGPYKKRAREGSSLGPVKGEVGV